MSVLAHVPRPFGPGAGWVMRKTGRKAAEERDQRAGLRVALVVAPFVLLFLVLLAVKSAYSSGSFQIDNRLVLEDLKREIAASVPQPPAQAAPETGTVAIRDPATTAIEAEAPESELREIREVVHRGDTLGGILRRIGLSADEVTRWSGTKRRHVSLARLQPG